MMQFTHDEGQRVATGKFGIRWELAAERGRVLTNHEDVRERRHEREAHVGCRKEHREVRPLDAVEEVRLFEQNKLQEVVLIWERHPVEQHPTYKCRQDEAECFATIEDGAHAELRCVPMY